MTNNKIMESKNKLNDLKINLEKNDFNQILEKGFVLICDEESNFIKKAKQIKNSQEISLIFKDGKVKGKFLKEKS